MALVYEWSNLAIISWVAIQPTVLPGAGATGGSPCMQGDCLSSVGRKELTSRRAKTRGLQPVLTWES